METLELIIREVAISLFCCALCTMLHFGWANRKSIVNELNLKKG